jgi:hypothetical protein
LGDEGSGGVGLTNNGGAVSVAGVDGSGSNAFHFSGAQSLSSTDVGLPSGTNPRTYGCWFKTTTLAAMTFIGWGTASTGHTSLGMISIGHLRAESSGDHITGPFVADGRWHFAVVVEENSPFDGVKRKLYLDGRLVGTSLTLNSNVLAGANKFRIGALPNATNFATGQIDGCFVNNVAFSAEEMLKLYAKASQAMPAAPKNAGDHIEGFSITSLFGVFDTLDSTVQISLGVG